MKTSLIAFVLALIFNSYFFASKIGIPAPFGTQEKIIKVRELPDNFEFRIRDGSNYDIGSLYMVKRFFWLGYSYGEPKYVGYLNSQKKYAPFTSEELKQIAERAKIQIPKAPEISFFDRYISRLLLLCILGLSGFYGHKFYIRRKKIIAEKEQEELPSWPPSTSH
ncbi:hypothetical protein [Maribacter sp. 2308TA10-17]|uniref:hypothetical protein n=1 Tax=Maribacter sp. 2308TA10-17 TaxID=3386276 RepID=UPI0039BD5B91